MTEHITELALGSDGSARLHKEVELPSMDEIFTNPELTAVLQPILHRLENRTMAPLVVPNAAPNLVILRDNSNQTSPVQGHLRIRELTFPNQLALTAMETGRLVWTPTLERSIRGHAGTTAATAPLVWRVPDTWRLFWSLAFDHDGTNSVLVPFPATWRIRCAWMSLLSVRGKTIYRPGLPNIHPDSRICFGTAAAERIFNYRAASAVEAVEFAWDQFCQSPWNTDLFDGHGTTMEALVRYDGTTLEQIPPTGSPEDGAPHTRGPVGLAVARGLLTAFRYLK